MAAIINLWKVVPVQAEVSVVAQFIIADAGYAMFLHESSENHPPSHTKDHEDEIHP